MKTFAIAAGTLLISFSAHACPELAGTYRNCLPSQAGSEVAEITIKKFGENYEFSTLMKSGKLLKSMYVTDGEPVTSESAAEEGTKSITTTRSTCEGSRLRVDSEVEVPQFGLTLSMLQNVSLTMAGDLAFDLSMNGSLPATVICKKAQ